MRTITGILATSYADISGATNPTASLEAMIEQINAHYYPIEFEYDPRKPHQGRWISAKMIKLDDDTFAVEGSGEIFEPGDQIPLENNNRELPLSTFAPEKITLVYDQNFDKKAAHETIKKIDSLLGSQSKSEFKRYHSPLSVLTLGLQCQKDEVCNVITQSFNKGILSSIISELKALLKQSVIPSSPSLIKIEINMQSEQFLQNTSIIMHDPDELNHFLATGLNSCKNTIKPLQDADPTTKKWVLQMEDNNPVPLFAVRKDALIIYC